MSNIVLLVMVENVIDKVKVVECFGVEDIDVNNCGVGYKDVDR